MENLTRSFQVLKEFTLGDQSLEVGAIVEFTEDAELERFIAEGFVVEVTEHVISQEDIDANPNGGLVLGETTYLPRVVPKAEMTDEQKAERDAAEAKIAEEAAASKASESEVPKEEQDAIAKKAADEALAVAEASRPKYVYNGQPVISESVREVEGHEWHALRLGDGTTVDVSDADYQAMVDASNA